MKPKLEYFSHGPFVVELQTRLNALMPGALPPLKVDGTYGDGTVARVKQFQKSRGLVADGVVGAKTWAAVDGTAPGAPGSGPSPAQKTGSLPSVHKKGLKVQLGARIDCTFGTQSSPFMFHRADGANVTDHQPFLNIIPFGCCQSPKHPGFVAPGGYADPLMDVSFVYGVSPPKCTPKTTIPWQSFGIGLVGGHQILDKSSTCICGFGGLIQFK